MILLNWKLRVTLGQFGIFMPPSQWVKEGIMVLAGVYDPDEQDVLLDHNQAKMRLTRIQMVPGGISKLL